MKLIKGCLLTLLAVSAVYAADDKDLPPGLRKKDKLPPGWEKKQRGASDDAKAVVTTNLPAPAVPATPATPGVPAAPAPTAPAVAAPAKAVTPRPAKQVKADLTARAESINKMDNRPAVLRAGLEAAAKETGVPLSKLQNQHKEHPEMGTAGLVMANAIAAKTNKRPAQLIESHKNGKSWAEIATDNKVDLEALNASLGRVEQAMKNVK